MTITSQLRPACAMLAVLTVLCGAAYPALVTGVAQLAFPAQAAGSLLSVAGKPVGSRLIGQSFSAPRYFWGRPSATAPMANNAAGSSGSNQGPSNPALVDAVKGRIAALRAADPANHAAPPVDLVTASASGLDPEISPAAAFYQAGRVARARGIECAAVEDLVRQHTAHALFGVFGEERVNVLELNLALDALAARR